MKCIDVTADNYPGVFRAFQMIDYDNGEVNRFMPEMQNYHVPASLIDTLSRSNKALLDLTPDELDTFCCGEQTEIEEIMSRGAALVEAYGLLNDYFDGELALIIDAQRKRA